MGVKASKGVLEVPYFHSTSVPSVTYKLLAASWHQRKCPFLEHSFGGADAACYLPLCVLAVWARGTFKGEAALNNAG